ncbi:MAG: hypothetical protein LBD76_08195 [Prevotellaceae bacterium]|jgi:hypothetical protein|nr:hypothetical protein [Prevotellaceae bacterium]
MKVKSTFLLIIALLGLLSFASAQKDTGKSELMEHIRQQRAEFERYKQGVKRDFENYRDSINREYAKFLEQRWKVFDLQEEEHPIKTPIPEPPVYDSLAPKREPEKIPVITSPKPLQLPLPLDETPQPEPQPEPEPDKPVPDETPQPRPKPSQYPVKAEFFGASIELKKLSPLSIKPLSGVSEQDVASYWNQLSQQTHEEWSNEMQRIKTELNLNDWGMYLLINKLFEVYFPSGVANEQVVFTVFMLNQSGYRAKIGRNRNELVPLIAFANKVHYMYFFRYGEGENEIKYSALNPRHEDMSSIRACEIDYPGATLSLDMRIENMPRLTASSHSKTLNYNQNTCTVNYNKNFIDFYSTYPCVEFSVYAEAPFDRESLQSIESQIAPDIRNKSQEEAVNLLLHFVQRYFEYQTDTQQYGHERWLFAEETLASSYSDCEDRSILFAQLVRRILGMQVALIYYPGVHLATAVKFDNPQTDGDYVVVDGEKYLICDPTYIGANLGAAMPKLEKISVEIIKLKMI